MTTERALAEVIDGDTGEVTARPVTALAKVSPGARLLALDSMDEAEFTERLSVLRTSQERMRRIQKELLGDGDFGVVPGTRGKPSLLKPGAEKLLKFYGLVPTFEIVRTVGDGVLAPSVHVAAQCSVHVGDAQGPVIAQGDGTCSTWERKYRFRRDGSENTDPHDLDNTIVKMAVKRALVAATLIATATSGLFTQDLEDMEPDPATLPPSVRATRMLEALAACANVKAFDALVAEMAPAALQLPEDIRTDFRAKVVTLRKPLYEAAKSEWEARQAARDAAAREPDPAPVESPAASAQRAELAAAFRAREPGDDGPSPEDETAALALVPVGAPEETAEALTARFAKVLRTKAWQTASPTVQALAKANVESWIATLTEGK